MNKNKMNLTRKEIIEDISNKILEENNEAFKILSKYDTFVYEVFCSAILEYELNFVTNNNFDGYVFNSPTTDDKYTLIITNLAQSNLDSILHVLSNTNNDKQNFKKFIIDKYKTIHKNPNFFDQIDLHYKPINEYRKVILNDYAIIFYIKNNIIYISNIIYIGRDLLLGEKIENEQSDGAIEIAILEFESEIKDNENPKGSTLEEFSKRVKKAVWNID